MAWKDILGGVAGAVIAGEATARVVNKVIAEFKAVEPGSCPPGLGEAVMAAGVECTLRWGRMHISRGVQTE